MAEAGAKERLAVGAVRHHFSPWSDPTAVPLIRYDNVTKRFGSTVAVDQVSLSIYEREFFCLLGPSGCGKTTLMRMLAGFEAPDEGRILLGNKDLDGTPPYRRPVNMMFQSYALFPHMSVADNIAFGLRQEALPKGEIAARVEEMLRLVQLTPLARRRPEQLSGGQRQRVALARALARRPKVLLLDEPLGALDKNLRERTQFELMDIQMTLGTTFLVVTHDQEEAMTMADRIAVMDHGRIAQLDPPNVIYEAPASRYVASFIGDVNLFEGKLAGREGDNWIVESAAAGGRLKVGASGETAAVGQDVAVAVRPEKMMLAREAPAEAVNRLAGEVWDIGYLGDWTTYVVRLPGGLDVKASRANVSRYVARPVSWEEEVVLSFTPEAAVLLTK